MEGIISRQKISAELKLWETLLQELTWLYLLAFSDDLSTSFAILIIEMKSESVTGILGGFRFCNSLLDLRQTMNVTLEAIRQSECCLVNKEWVGPSPAQYPLETHQPKHLKA